MKTFKNNIQIYSNRIKHSLLRISIGVIYLWFGGLKFFDSLSPAEALASETIQLMTMNMIPQDVNYLILAIGEVIIGILLVLNLKPRITILLAIAHMIGTFMPMVLIPEVVFDQSPFSLTLVGQYILKNLVVISALLVIFPGKEVTMRVVGKLEKEEGYKQAV